MEEREEEKVEVKRRKWWIGRREGRGEEGKEAVGRRRRRLWRGEDAVEATKRRDRRQWRGGGGSSEVEMS